MNCAYSVEPFGDALLREPRLDARTERGRIEDRLRDAAARVGELARRHFGRAGRAEIDAADDAAERVTDEMNA